MGSVFVFVLMRGRPKGATLRGLLVTRVLIVDDSGRLRDGLGSILVH